MHMVRLLAFVQLVAGAGVVGGALLLAHESIEQGQKLWSLLLREDAECGACDAAVSRHDHRVDVGLAVTLKAAAPPELLRMLTMHDE